MEAPDVRNLGEYDTVAFKTFSAAASSLALGTIAGAVTATWNDVPAVERNQALPAFRKTARIMGSYGTYFAAVGGIFAATDAIAQEIRGKRDIWNGVMGGFAAGAVVGVRGENMSSGFESQTMVGDHVVQNEPNGPYAMRWAGLGWASSNS